MLQYDIEAKYRLISRKYFGREVFSLERSLNQPKASRVGIRSLNQSNRTISSISVSLLFLFCSRVFVSRSYENRGASSFLNDSSLNYLTRSKSFKMFFYLFSPYFVTLESLRLPQNNAKCRKISASKNVEALSRQLFDWSRVRPCFSSFSVSLAWISICSMLSGFPYTLSFVISVYAEHRLSNKGPVYG